MRKSYLAIAFALLMSFTLGFVCGPKIRQAQIEKLYIETFEWRTEDRLNKLIAEEGLENDPEIKAVLDENERGFVVQGIYTSDFTDGTISVAPILTPKVEKLIRQHLTFGMPWIEYSETWLYFD